MNNKVQVNARNAIGGTALLEACKRGNLEMVKLLIDAGADPALPLNDGRTPLMVAEYFGHQDVVDLLQQHLQRDLVGYVFLSWTTNHPRDDSATRIIKQALIKCAIGLFDYTKHPVDDSRDQTEIIEKTIRDHVGKSDCSIELITSEILGAGGPPEGSDLVSFGVNPAGRSKEACNELHREFINWVQFERDELYRHGKPRLFVCLEEHYMLAESSRGEENIIRLNLSDGRIGIRAETWERDRSQDGYYRSMDYYNKCVRLACLLRKSLETNNWEWLRTNQEFARRVQ